MHDSTVTILLFVSICLLSIPSTTRAIFRHFHYGNEYEQFQRYEQLTADQFDLTEYFNDVNECEQSTVPEKGFRSYLCRYHLREKRQKVMKPIWQRKEDDRKYKVDCKYDVFSSNKSPSLAGENGLQVIRSVIREKSLIFEIKQHTCESNVQFSGGSTFEIILQSTAHLSSCNVVDQFDSIYIVYCPLPSNYKQLSIQSVSSSRRPIDGGSNFDVCGDISITLHYEHYDAFDDVGHSKFSSLHHNLYTGLICASSSLSPSLSSSVSEDNSNTVVRQLVHSTSDDPRSDPLWLRRPNRIASEGKAIANQYSIVGNTADANKRLFESIHQCSTGNTVQHFASAAVASNNAGQQQTTAGTDEIIVYEWRGQISKYLTIPVMKQCLKRQVIWFIGESHMRYQFDITMDRYIDKLNMGRYHGNVNISGISYNDNTFGTRLIKLLNELPCSPTQQQTTLVLQTGSWDLQFFPPRAFIRNPKQGLGIVNAIKQLFERPYCKQNYHIIWMATMPHPYCLATNEHCMRLMNYWRNNGAIRAVNQFMEIELSKLNINSNNKEGDNNWKDFNIKNDNIVVIDTPSIALPRFFAASASATTGAIATPLSLNDIVCVDHFLCNDPPRGFITTPTGIAISNEVLTYSCAKELQQQLENNDGIPTSFADGQLIKHFNISSNQLEFYSIEGGCKRQFPDRITLQYMTGLQASEHESLFTSVSAEYVLRIPICFRNSFLSYANDLLYQAYSSRSVYYMDSGFRRQLNGVNSLISLGKDFDQVKMVLEKDLESIPAGPTIMGKDDCNWCKAK